MTIIIETNCVLPIKRIHGDHKRHSNRELILRIQKFCKYEWRVLIKQVSREMNSAADTLAKLMKDSPIDERFFHVNPSSIDDQIW